jgi:hypothetical protein
MTHYFTREEAEKLLPEISIILENIQAVHRGIGESENELEALRLQAMGNGHHLHERNTQAQKSLATNIQQLQIQYAQLEEYGCKLKDPSIGLIDFLSERDGREIYLCWHLGETGINFWHYPEAGFAGRQPL